MKRRLAVLAAATVLAGSLVGGGAVSAEMPKVTVTMPIKLLYNARQLATEVQPVNENGTVLVPIRFVSDKLGGKLTLSGTRIVIVKGTNKLEMTIGSSKALVNGKTITLPVPVRVTSGRTMVPLRVISEGLGTPVEYDAGLKFVWIGNKDVPTLEEVVKGKLVSAGPFLKKYPRIKYFLDDYSNQTQISVLDATDFPFITGNEYHYRMDLAYIGGEQYIQSSTTDKGVMLTAYYYLTSSKSMPVRDRSAYYREVKDNLRLNYYPIASGKDYEFIGNAYKDLTFNDIDYIGMNLPGDTSVIVKNPLR